VSCTNKDLRTKSTPTSPSPAQGKCRTQQPNQPKSGPRERAATSPSQSPAQDKTRSLDAGQEPSPRQTSAKAAVQATKQPQGQAWQKLIYKQASPAQAQPEHCAEAIVQAGEKAEPKPSLLTQPKPLLALSAGRCVQL